MSPSLIMTLLLLAASPRPATLAVAYFDNNTGKEELAPLSRGLADTLITDLSQVGSLQLVERQRLNDVLAELKLSKSAYVDPKSAQKLGRGLAAQYLMTGGYSLARDTLRIDARLIRVETGAVITAERVEGPKEDFFALEKELVEALVRSLDIKLASTERSKLRANATQSYDAWAQYSAGLVAADKGEVSRARELFEKALAADPNYRAARTASERLAAIFDRADRQVVASADAAYKSLDPQAPDFAQRVDELLMSLDNTKSEQLRRKIELLQWLGSRKLIACQQQGGTAVGSYCRQAAEVLGVAFRLVGDPSQWEVIPKVCENLIHRLPGNQGVLSYCERALMDSLNSEKSQGADEAKRALDEDRAWVLENCSSNDWRRALIENDARMKEMLQVYARWK
ncbi:MAG: hypothetical protein HY901_16575 [Deltaproteobacteria bacterium]|nr:hypothetical protein [Deltaproteobacteria bacterium]